MAAHLRLKELRERSNLTQEEMAALAGYAQAQISRWERGKGNPNIAQIRQLAKKLRVHPGELFEPIQRDHANDLERRVLDIAGKLKGEDLAIWLETGERLARSSAGNGTQRPKSGNDRRSRAATSRDMSTRSTRR